MAPTTPARRVREKASAKRRARNAEHARRDILEAAASIFAERGFREARVQDIAERAGYTAGALYTYFKSKTELFDALAESVTKEMEVVLTEAPAPGTDFATRLEAMVQRTLSVAERHHQSVVYFMRLINEGGPRPRRADLRDIDFVTRLGTWVEANACEEDLGGRTPQDVGDFVWSVLTGVVRVWAVRGSTGAIADRAVDTASYLLHGLKCQTPQGGPKRRGAARGKASSSRATTTE